MNYQEFKGWPRLILNQSLPKQLAETECYAFPMHLVNLVNNQFQQTRSGPNWQGGVLTLTTCKHRLRTGKPIADWVGVWLAGFTPKVGCGDNYLLFLAQVRLAFASNYELGAYLAVRRPSVYFAKLVNTSTLGDIYQAKRVLPYTEQYDWQNYTEPVGHVRMELKNNEPKWHKDINYVGAGGRQPAMLLFSKTYLYSKPVYRCVRPLGRSGYKTTPAELELEHV